MRHLFSSFSTPPMKKIILMAAIALITSCSAQKGSTADDSVVTGTNAHIPQAIAYQTSGNYNDNVPVTLNAAGDRLVSFPGPGDVSPEASAPIPLDDGWLLDRRGVSANTAFTTYTYAQYHALSSVPDNLLESVIPGAVVTRIIRFPVTINQITPALANKLIKTADYTTLYAR